MNVRSVNTDEKPGKRRRGRPLVDDKRRRILDAALAVFASRGYHGTAVPEVADAAKVGTGTLYRYFATKEALVNEVYRDAKARLRAALLGGPTFAGPPGEAWFMTAWARLIAFARTEPAAFQFLEMQDHAPYLDRKSREVELSVLAPLWLAGKQLRSKAAKAKDGLPVDVLIALVWGAFVGLVKADRLGYLRLDDKTLMRAGAVCWRVISEP
jgi:TetR/AcrR family transcriptional regulator, repressor of fatR-cypB operon